MLICKSFSFECCLALRSSNRPFSTVIFSTFHDSMLWLTVQLLNGLLVQILLFLKDGQLVVHRSLVILRSRIELQYGLFKEGVYHFVSNSNLYSPFTEESVLCNLQSYPKCNSIEDRRCASANSPTQKLCGIDPERPLEPHSTRVLGPAQSQTSRLLDRSQIPAR